MYYNKELFVNEEIKTKYKKLLKLQTVLALSIVLSIAAIWLACFVALLIMYDDFMYGYLFAAFGTLLLVAVFAALIPCAVAMNKLRAEQTEAMNGQPIYDKYVVLLQAGRKFAKSNNCYALAVVAVCLIVAWVLAIVFPYELYIVALPFVVAGITANLRTIFENRKVKEIKSMENEIAAELSKNVENENGDAVSEE